MQRFCNRAFGAVKAENVFVSPQTSTAGYRKIYVFGEAAVSGPMRRAGFCRVSSLVTGAGEGWG